MGAPTITLVHKHWRELGDPSHSITIESTIAWGQPTSGSLPNRIDAIRSDSRRQGVASRKPLTLR
jgi:hypothetical protein